LSVLSNTLLTAGKLVAGILTGSVSIMSEAAHSAIDLLAAGLATFSVHAADVPPDQDHPYGHQKIENVSGVIEGALIFLAAAWIVYEAVHKIIEGVELQHLGPGMAVMAVSATVNAVVSRILYKTAKAERSVALEADGAHLLTDVYTSLGVFLGLFVITVGERFFGADLSWIDPIIAIGVALLILSTAYRITRKSFMPLIDVAASPEEIACITDIMGEFGKAGVDTHNLRTRKAGGALHVDLHMGFRRGVSLEQGHLMSHEIKGRIEECLPGANVLIHVEPSARTEELPEDSEEVICIKGDLIKDERVCGVEDVRAFRQDGEIRVEADLCIDPKVTMAESEVLSSDLRKTIVECYPAVREVVLSLLPGDGWQEAIHDDDKELIRKVVREHEGRLAGIHYLRVSSSGGRRHVTLGLGVPPSLPVSEAHRIGSRLEEDIKRIFRDQAEIDLHIEPCHEQCESCSAACPERNRNTGA